VEDIKPLSTFKQKAAEIIAHIKETGQPTVITINGNAEVVIQDAQAYQEMLDKIEYLDNVRKIQRGLDEVKANKAVSYKKAFANFKQKQRS
jgi:PHD/YefM family antitoxin component YafN of YafNO toxin-antitoxin module